MARRTFERARWSRTRWLPSLMPSASLPSSGGKPSTSLSVIPAFCASGNWSMACRIAILHAIDQLPEAQKAGITLRDVDGFPPEEGSEALGISDGNQRVLLHRARSKVRRAIEAHLGAVEPNSYVLERS